MHHLELPPPKTEGIQSMTGPTSTELSAGSYTPGQAVANAALHAFAAFAALVVLDGARPALLAIFVGVELALALCLFITALRTGRLRLGSAQMRFVEGSLAALNFAFLPWIGNGLAGDEPVRYVLMLAYVAYVASSGANAAMTSGRWKHMIFHVALTSVSYLIAYAIETEWLLATFVLIWAVAVPIQVSDGFKAMDQLAAQRARSLSSARKDDLTGLLNRSAFVSEMEHLLDTKANSALILIDLDGFKAINDGYGHAAGDGVLRTVALRLDEIFPTGTIVGRLGGDEFAMLVPTSDIDLASTVRRAVDGVCDVVTVDGRDLYVSASAGWTELRPLATPAELMAEADAAMYRSKTSTSTRATGFGPSMRDELDRSLELRQLFRTAVRSGSIDFLAQPIVRVSDAMPVAVELLARWPQRQSVEIAVAEFNRLADETGLAVELDRLALEAAADLLNRWADDPVLHPVLVKVNTSPTHLHNLALAHTIRSKIPKEHRSRLGLEFVESKLITTEARHHAVLADIQAMGVTIALDDFGTGYSSLAYLKQLPVHEVKIDQTFVTQVHGDPVNQGLIRAIVDIATTLELTTVAEGVESQADLDTIVTLGVDRAQGFYTGRPANFDAVTIELSKRRSAVSSRDDR